MKRSFLTIEYYTSINISINIKLIYANNNTIIISNNEPISLKCIKLYSTIIVIIIIILFNY
jgi:hypothetical protein